MGEEGKKRKKEAEGAIDRRCVDEKTKHNDDHGRKARIPVKVATMIAKEEKKKAATTATATAAGARKKKTKTSTGAQARAKTKTTATAAAAVRKKKTVRKAMNCPETGGFATGMEKEIMMLIDFESGKKKTEVLNKETVGGGGGGDKKKSGGGSDGDAMDHRDSSKGKKKSDRGGSNDDDVRSEGEKKSGGSRHGVRSKSKNRKKGSNKPKKEKNDDGCSNDDDSREVKNSDRGGDDAVSTDVVSKKKKERGGDAVSTYTSSRKKKDRCGDAVSTYTSSKKKKDRCGDAVSTGKINEHERASTSSARSASWPKTSPSGGEQGSAILVENNELEHEQDTGSEDHRRGSYHHQHGDRSSPFRGNELKTLLLICLVANIISVVLCVILFIGEFLGAEFLGCDCGGCFMCVYNVFVALVSIPFGVIGVVGICYLNVPMIAVTTGWYIATSIIVSLHLSEGDFRRFDNLWLWISLSIYPVFVAAFHLRLLLDYRDGEITQQHALCRGCCGYCGCCANESCVRVTEDDTRDCGCFCL